MFQISINLAWKILLKKQYGHKVNKNNITTLSRRKINFIFKNEEKKLKREYICLMINDWIKINKMNDIILKELKKTIRRNKLKLNNLEKEKYELFNERVFSIDRHIKKLDVNTELKNREIVGIKFLRSEIYNYNKSLSLLSKGELLISNLRIMIIFSDQNELSYNWNDIKKIKYSNYGFEFTYLNNKYLIRIHDQETLNNTIKNFIKRRLKNEIY